MNVSEKKDALKNAGIEVKGLTNQQVNDLYVQKVEGKEVVNGFVAGCDKRPKKERAKFLNREITLPLCTVVLNSLFISNKEKALDRTTANAEKVFCTLSFVHENGTSIINDDWDVARVEFGNAGKSLLSAEGTSIEQKALIDKGVYKFPA